MMEKTGQIDPAIVRNILRNRTEMFAYNLIATARSSIESAQQVLTIDWNEFETEEDKKFVKDALKIQMTIKNSQFVEFFRILRRPTTNYFFACLMLIHYNTMREEAVHAFI